MPRSLLGRLTAVLGLLLVAAVASGLVMFSLFEQSTAARIGQASAVAGQACGAIARTYRLSAGDRSRVTPDVADPTLRRDLTAVVATALADRPGFEGGFWQDAAGPVAYAYPTYDGGEPKTDVPAAELSRIRSAARTALAEDRPQLARYDAPAETLLIASCPLPGPVPALAAWTMTRVHSFTGGAYDQLMAGLGVLAAATAGAVLLVTRLLVTWRRHVGRIEAAFAQARDGDLPRLASTGERELDRIVLAMNDAGARLDRSREEMQVLSRQVAEAERLAAVGRVAAGIAHEIRNPIAAMRLKAEMALRGDRQRMTKALDLVIGQVDRLETLVRRLLAVTERSCPQPVHTDLVSFLESCAAPHRRPGGPAVDVASGVASARLDEGQMRRALDSLLANAVEASGDRPVTLTAERDGDRFVLSVCCPGCGARAVAERPAGAGATPFGPRLHALVLYLKTFQALSYERLEGAMKDLFGLTVSQGGLTNMLRRAEARFAGGRDTALAALQSARVVACDETGIRIEGTNSYPGPTPTCRDGFPLWVFRCAEAVVHHVAPTRSASVVRDVMGDHRPDVWLSDRYSAQQGHGKAHQTCLAHLARDVASALDGRDEALALGLKLWLGSAFALAEAVTTLAASTIASRRRALERRLDDLLARATTCDLTRAVQDKIRRARDQLLTFTVFPGQVEPTNNACERDLRPAVIQRKVTNGYRATWSAEGEAAVRTVVSTERINHGPGTFTTLLKTVSA